MLFTAPNTAVLSGDILDPDDAVAGAVLLEVAVVAVQHDGVRVTVHAQALYLG